MMNVERSAMRGQRRLRYILAAVLVASGVIAEQRAPRPPALNVVAPAALEPVAAGLRRLDTQKLVAVMGVLGLGDGGAPITVMLASEESPVARETPAWVAGFANGAAGVIVLFPERTPSYPYDSMEALLHHEVAHVLVTRAAHGAEIPRWFHEGLAIALERPWGLRDRSELALAVIGGRRSLATIERDFRGGESSAARAYGVAGAFVRDLLGRYGAGFPARLLSSLASGTSFDDAFAAAAATSLAEAERRFWQDSWWYRVVPFLTSSIVLWLGIMTLAIAAWRRRAARRRARREQWDEEERLVQPLPPEP
jgi:hypothetical protein